VWHGPSGWGEVWRLALPLILANSFWTLQITIDRVLLARLSSEAVGAAMAAVMLFWTPLTLLQSTAAYATSFVAQYYGAGRHDRIGPAVWQALYFSVITGLGFLALVPLAPTLVALGGHSPELQELEAIYFRCLCWSALPTLITAAVSSLFTGLGRSWTVLLVNGTGLAVNAVLDYALIFGYAGFPEMGIAGAGWATVIGTAASAVLACALALRAEYRGAYATLAGCRFDAALFARLLRFGLPSGLQWALDALAFTVFTLLVGRMGDAELAATSITFTLNLVAVLPALGIAQAVSVLVGQRLGEDRPALAERATWSGFQMAWLYMALVAAGYCLFPAAFAAPFHNAEEGERAAAVAELVPLLLKFVAVYCLFDSMNLVFSFALKGAGDTRFVTAVALALAWPMMVLPTWAAWYYGWGLVPAWGAASAYIVALALVFLARFRGGRWKSMRVIEAAPAAAEVAAPAAP
jgi:MATE family multidrug resistance protein